MFPGSQKNTKEVERRIDAGFRTILFPRGCHPGVCNNPSTNCAGGHLLMIRFSPSSKLSWVYIH